MRRDLHKLGARESGQHLPSALELSGGWLHVDRVDLQQPIQRDMREGSGNHGPFMMVGHAAKSERASARLRPDRKPDNPAPTLPSMEKPTQRR